MVGEQFKDPELEREFHKISVNPDTDVGGVIITTATLKDIVKDDVFFITEKDGEVVKDDNDNFMFKAIEDPNSTYLGFLNIKVATWDE